MRNAIVMAAGKGTRMNSDIPKVLHKVCEVPMVELIVRNLSGVGAERIVTIVGYGHEQVEAALEGRCEFALQSPQLGTGHAVMQARQLENESGYTVVANGDTPCVKQETFEMLYQALDENDMAVLVVALENPGSYGRVVTDSAGNIQKIVEFKDADLTEKSIKLINTGIYAFRNEELFAGLKELKNDNSQNEYYITDLVEIFLRKGLKVKAVETTDAQEVQGVNDNIQLAQANTYLRQQINEFWMRRGVTIVDPANAYIGVDVHLGKDVTIYPNVSIYGHSSIGSQSVITSNSFLMNAEIGERTIIDSSKIVDSEVKSDCQIGPFAHFRNNTVVEEKNRVGNFVEFKNVHFGADSRCAHLTYLGDATVGIDVNIGCGVITVNYDGANKYRTTIHDGAFVGSNSNLVAPVTVGKGAVVAAGSTVTKDVPDSDMAIGRVRQENLSGYGKAYLDRNRAKKKALQNK